MAEGRLAQLEQHTNEAARCYIDLIRVGQEAVRGGLLSDRLFGTVLETLGSSALAKIVPALDANECRAAISALEEIQARRESPEETLRIERAWVRENRALMDRVDNMIESLSFKSVDKQIVGNVQAEISRQSGILIDLASRAYQLERGRVPTNVNELVPDFLKAVPQKPPTTN